MKQLSQSRNDLSVDVSGSKSNKEQYSIGTWNLKSVNQGKLDMVKQEMARVNVNKITSMPWRPEGDENPQTWC